ncbi:hypothetical protein DES35_101781 [Schleiferia thermophila]|jgi:hypothetical protein|uniref:Uncharacterized protein n=1 Tax=Schleiferia thermophila TaxID=884107 RepID=A0A369ADJ0_9FLAO|nr:hypothetical protein DES35_101781 [Schleiferia thermophila]
MVFYGNVCLVFLSILKRNGCIEIHLTQNLLYKAQHTDAYKK